MSVGGSQEDKSEFMGIKFCPLQDQNIYRYMSEKAPPPRIRAAPQEAAKDRRGGVE